LNPLGSSGEELAARFLEDAGCEILERSFRSKTGEIDLIVRDGDALVFVEVKARSKNGFGGPVEAVTRAKQAKIAKTAALYLQRCRFDYGSVRFDVVAVLDGRIEHLKDAFPSPIRFTL
jgi:putative endonuclease